MSGPIDRLPGCGRRSSSSREMMRLLLLCIPALAAAAPEEQQRYGAVEIVPQGLAPRFFLDSSRASVVRRDGSCGDGNHNCLDIQHPERCCDNDSYCYISKDSEPKCCPIGSNCVNDSFCSSQAYFCTHTSTLVLTAPSSTVTTQSPATGCCQRACPQTSHYLCPQSLGGNCCPFGSNCQYGGNCVSTQTATPTPRLTPVVQGCTTAQHSCSEGAGCCDNSMLCTVYQGTGYCADPTAVPTATGGALAGGRNLGGGGPSKGATVGIAVGVSLGGAFLIGCLAWLFFARRRHDRRDSEDANGKEGHGPAAAQANETSGMASVSPSTNILHGYNHSDSGPWSPDQLSTASPPPPPTPQVVLHEPNGPGAAPVEIDSAERVEVEDRKAGGLSPGSQVSELESPTDGDHARGLTRPGMTTSWLQLSPISPSTPSSDQI